LPASVDLKPAVDTYRGTLTLSAPVLEGYVSVEVPQDASSPPRAIVTDYALGGNPAPPRRPPRRMRRRAPLTSPDGQVILYSDDLIFNPDEFFFFALQTATRLPEPPFDQTIIGQGYRLITSDASRLVKAVIDMTYADSDAPRKGDGGSPTKEVAIYYYGKDPQGFLHWQQLHAPVAATNTAEAAGNITALVVGAGVYVLMSNTWGSQVRLVRR